MTLGSTSLAKVAQCGQVGEAYSISVTGASALPITWSVTPPAGAISLATSTMSPSAALAVAIPQRLRAEAAAARMRVSRRLNFTANAPVLMRARLHAANVWASGHVHQPGVNSPVALSFSPPLGKRVPQCAQRLPQMLVGHLGHLGPHLCYHTRIGLRVVVGLLA